MSLKTIDPKNVILIVGGVPISGYADGTFINFERDEDAFSDSTGADGETVRVKSNNTMGNLTITLQQTSDSNSALSVIAQLDESANAGVVPVALKEIDGETVVASGYAWVRKLPAAEWGKEVSNREWQIRLSNSKAFIGGNAGVLEALFT